MRQHRRHPIAQPLTIAEAEVEPTGSGAIVRSIRCEQAQRRTNDVRHHASRVVAQRLVERCVDVAAVRVQASERLVQAAVHTGGIAARSVRAAGAGRRGRGRVSVHGAQCAVGALRPHDRRTARLDRASVVEASSVRISRGRSARVPYRRPDRAPAGRP
jgi:hypothetical protein